MDTADCLEGAIERCDVSIARQMLDADPSLAHEAFTGGISAIQLAAFSRCQQILRLLVDAGAIRGSADALLAGEADLLASMLTDNPADVNGYTPDGWTLLHLAGRFGHSGEGIALVSRGSDVNAWSHNPSHQQPLHSAIAGLASDEFVQALLRAGADINAGEMPALHQAAANRRIEVIKMLLALGADPLARAKNGKLAAEVALEAGYGDVAALLVSK